jgi:hypothetical protein
VSSRGFIPLGGSAFPDFVQKNIKKSIDSDLPLCHSDGTHGNINTQIK